MLSQKPSLYIVSTPIGNLGDISQRAIEILRAVDIIAAEDTRHSGKLLQHLSISTPCISFHEHNERDRTHSVITRLQNGESIALISDAGTPLISDPGYQLVNAAHEAGIPVIPIPGASAVLSALAAAGLPTDRFVFEGFLPNKRGARLKVLEKLMAETGTLVFYESPHRIIETLTDMTDIFGKERVTVLARELTKTFETIRRDSLENLLGWVKEDSNQQKGEIVLVVAGAKPVSNEGLSGDTMHILKVLLGHVSVKQAASIAAELSGQKKNQLYEAALKLQGKD